MTNPHLNLTVNETGIELDCLLPNGFAVKVSGQMNVILPLLSAIWAEVQKSLPTETKKPFEGVLSSLPILGRQK